MNASISSVSVAMATYNGERWLRPQLTSIVEQLGADDELLVVDDASSDGTVALIGSFNDSRIRVLRNETNRGVRASFERALRAVRGDVIFLADQDDVWLPGKYAQLSEALGHGALLALADAAVIGADGQLTSSSFMASRGGFRGSLAATLVKNRYLGCAMAFRRELLDYVLPIPPTVPMHDMWIGALASLHGRVAYIDRPLMQYRRHGGNVSPGSRAGVGQMLVWRWRLLTLLVARLARGPVPVIPELPT